METQLRQLVHTIPYYRKEACEVTLSDLSALYQRQWITERQYGQVLMGNSNQITRGSIGCFLSHLQLLRHAVDMDTSILILEDDVCLKPNFESDIQAMIESIRHTSFDMIYLEQPLPWWKDTASDYNESLYQIQKGYFGTFAYMIHPRHAKRILEHTTSIDHHIDNWYLILHTKWSTPVYLLKSSILTTDISTRRNSDVVI